MGPDTSSAKDTSATVGGSRPPQIAILGEFDPEFPPHPATNAAILHSSHQLRAEVGGVWLSTQDIHLDLLKGYAGIWVAPGSPYKDLEKNAQRHPVRQRESFAVPWDLRRLPAHRN